MYLSQKEQKSKSIHESHVWTFILRITKKGYCDMLVINDFANTSHVTKANLTPRINIDSAVESVLT